jgi:hypothetical protein
MHVGNVFTHGAIDCFAVTNVGQVDDQLRQMPAASSRFLKELCMTSCVCATGSPIPMLMAVSRSCGHWPRSDCGYRPARLSLANSRRPRISLRRLLCRNQPAWTRLQREIGIRVHLSSNGSSRVLRIIGLIYLTALFRVVPGCRHEPGTLFATLQAEEALRVLIKPFVQHLALER